MLQYLRIKKAAGYFSQILNVLFPAAFYSILFYFFCLLITSPFYASLIPAVTVQRLAGHEKTDGVD